MVERVENTSKVRVMLFTRAVGGRGGCYRVFNREKAIKSLDRGRREGSGESFRVFTRENPLSSWLVTKHDKPCIINDNTNGDVICEEKDDDQEEKEK